MKLVDLATTIRSKNAGVDHITFDVICRDRANFERVRDSGVLNRGAVARLFGVEEACVTDFVVMEPAHAIKFNIRRMRPRGRVGESDLCGAQQYAPLFDVEIP